MNYIYDILLNFKDVYYDFYEWNKGDNIIHIRKIPIFRTDRKTLFDIKNNKVKLDIQFIEKLNNKTEIFSNKIIKKINACLISDGESILGINLIKNKLKLSSLLVDEELDLLEDVYAMEIENIKYNILKENKCEEFKTRKQIENEKFLNRELNKIMNNEEKIKYLYYECFNKKEENINKIKMDLYEVKEEKIFNKIYDFLKLLEINK